MRPVSCEDLARVSLPERGKRGWLVMLEAYLDDSGTHAGSPVVVWGGVAGHKYYLDKLDAAWRAQLLKPCDGKPPISKFHSYDLEHGIGEFEGYNQGERDLTRRNFRQVIVETSVTICAYGVSIADWDQLVRLSPSEPDFTAEMAVFGKAIWDLVKVAKQDGEALSLQFDQGRDTPHLRDIIKPTAESLEYDGRFLSYGFLPVGRVPALQAADLVVHEAFRAFTPLIANPNAVARPHARRLFEDPFAGTAQWMGRKEIQKAVKWHQRERKRREKRARKVRP